MKICEFSLVQKTTKAPFIPVIIMTQDLSGKNNPITVEWYMRTSIKPPMIAISIGHERYSYSCLQENRKFNIIIPSLLLADAVKYVGTESGSDKDKLKELNLATFKGHLGLEIFKDARAAYECEIVTQVKSGDHTIFVGEVKYSWLNETMSDLLLFPEKK